MSTLDREIFPTHVPHTRFGNDMTAIRGAPNRGPGCYENEKVLEEFVCFLPLLKHVQAIYHILFS